MWSRYQVLCLAVLLAALLLNPSPAIAQARAEVTGIVTDASGAVVAGAQVSVTNLDTAISTNVVSNEQGYYTAPLLPVGNYRILVAKEGFRSVARTGVRLEVDQVARIDFVVEVGQLTERIEIAGTAPLVDSQTSVVGQVIDNKRVVELPLNGRNYLQLAQLTTGVIPATGSRVESSGSFSSLGQRAYQLNIQLDGVDNASRASGGQLGFEAQIVTPSIDSISEFKVVTNNNSAEYGFRMGGTVIVATKSGGNQFHGSAYEFLRNDKLDGTNFFSVGQPKPPYRRNEFGGTLGGPVIHNRTFFFASYDGTRIRQGQSNISTVPNDAYRNGNFAGARTIFDPSSTRQNASGAYIRDPFAGNQIPRGRFDSVAANLIALYPLPNLPGIANNYYFSDSQRNDTDQVDTRIDHYFSDAYRFYARYSRRGFDGFTPGTLPEPADGGASQTTNVNSQSLVADLNQTISPTTNNEIRFGFVPMKTKIGIPSTENLIQKYGIKGVPDFGAANQVGLTQFQPTGYTTIGSKGSWPNNNDLDYIQISDMVLAMRGRHQFKAGAEFRREDVFRSAAQSARGVVGFDGSFSQDPANRGATGNGMADFILGTGSTAQISSLTGENGIALNYALFFQDDWKVTPRLTLNLGVRWDRYGPPSFRLRSRLPVSQFQFSADMQNYKIVYAKDDSDCGCVHNNRNFAPRIGLAYQLTPRTVIRSGFGMFFGEPDVITQNGQARFQLEAPNFTILSFPTDRLLQPALVVSQGFPPGLLPTTVVQPNSTLVFTEQPRLPDQYNMQWFFDVQRQLSPDTVFTVSYLGSGTRQLVVLFNLNLPYTPGAAALQSRRPNPFFGAINYAVPMGNSNYQAFAAKLEKRYARGLTLLGSYTWSHNIEFTQGNLGDDGGAGWEYNWNARANVGNATYDTRQSLVASGFYDLPFGKGRKWLNAHGPADWLLGGWQFGSILSLRTGMPFTPTVSTDLTNTGTVNHPNRIKDGTLSAGQRSIRDWFDLTAFPLGAQYIYGNSGRNILFGPGLRNMDLKIGKSFLFKENKRVEFRCEMFNFTNTPHFGQPNTNVNLPVGGTITTAAAPRQIQMGLKLVY